MLRKLKKKIYFIAIALGAVLSGNVLHAAPIIGLNDNNQLLTFDTASPSQVYQTLTVTGLQGGEFLVGIDFRPANNQLYALSNASRIYTINASTGAATQVGSDGAFVLAGTSFGLDFNPVPDRIRVVSNAEQNLRLNPNDGTLTSTDTNLAFAGGDVNNGANPNIVAAAYINNINGALTTTLYGIDSTLDILVTQNPPNNGTLNSVGALGINVAGVGGFDVVTNSTGPTDTAYAAFQVGTTTSLYTINLATGAATAVGAIGNGNPILRGITVGCLAPTISIDDVSIAEGNSGTNTLDFTATLSAACPAAISVEYDTVNGTATAGSDYVAASNTLTFAPNDTSETISVTINGDTDVEANETFTVDLSNPLGATLNDSSGTGTITNDDGATTDLSVTKEAPANIIVGRELTYRIEVENLGSVEATDVILSDSLPGRTKFLKATPSQGTCETPKKNKTGNIECDLGSIAAGDSATLRIRVKVVGPPRRTLTNTASVESNTAESDMDNNSDSTTTKTKNPGQGNGSNGKGKNKGHDKDKHKDKR